MFGEGDVFGMQPQAEAAPYEDRTPALPAPGQSPMQGDGSGNYQTQAMARQPEGAAPNIPPGAIVIPTGDNSMMGNSQMGNMGMQGATWAAMEPTDTSQPAAMRSAGFTALLVAGAIGIGVAVGGPWGAGAGLLLAGALANGYRAQKWWDSTDPSQKHEAVVSGVFATGSLGIAAYLAYKAYQAKVGEGGLSKNDVQEEEDED